MNAVILHPTAATAVPVTHVAPRASGLRQRKVKPATVKHATREDLVALVEARGLRPLKAHTKTELTAMLASGLQIRPAAYDRNNAARKAKRAAEAAQQATAQA